MFSSHQKHSLTVALGFSFIVTLPQTVRARVAVVLFCVGMIRSSFSGGSTRTVSLSHRSL